MKEQYHVDKRLEFGSAFSRVFELYSANFLPLILWSAAIQVGVAIVVGVLVVGVVAAGPIALIATPLVLAITFIGAALLSGAYIIGITDTETGKEFPGFGEVWSRVSPMFGALIVSSLLAGLGIALGLILLLVPGLILMTWWSVVAPVVVLEGKSGSEALGRSRELVKGNGWLVFGLIIVVGIISAIVGGIIGAILAAPFGGRDEVFGGIMNQFGGGVLTAPISALLALVMYQALTGATPGALPGAPGMPGAMPHAAYTPPTPAYTPPPAAPPATSQTPPATPYTPPSTGDGTPPPQSPITEH